ncbi:MAG: MBL fold metallo-hydrolase [Alphaproteobacteria bacterium]|nr:MBL fold metallo-hydrolase [Alphaproteobacteria bacterium]
MSFLRILHPHENIYAYYDGRVPGYRFSPEKNWVDDGALSLGIASYAIVSGDYALVYDTHCSNDYARAIRSHLKGVGVKHFTVLLSHWHLDHVAGTEVFADCEVIANAKTAAHLTKRKVAIEAGTDHGPPAINPLILPNKTFSSEMDFELGDLRLKFIACNIHSDDASVVWWPAQGILLAGDTMEDTITYVGEPESFDIHLAELDRLWVLAPKQILPNHGHDEVIARGGYGKTLIRATQQYIRVLKRMAAEPELRAQDLRHLISGPLEAGWVHYFAPYEEVHKENVEMVVRAKLN